MWEISKASNLVTNIDVHMLIYVVSSIDIELNATAKTVTMLLEHNLYLI
jgi:hypothetical protein